MDPTIFISSLSFITPPTPRPHYSTQLTVTISLLSLSTYLNSSALSSNFDLSSTSIFFLMCINVTFKCHSQVCIFVSVYVKSPINCFCVLWSSVKNWGFDYARNTLVTFVLDFLLAWDPCPLEAWQLKIKEKDKMTLNEWLKKKKATHS